ncbi:MAG: holo-ACP synthase [Proteobacteria bacterium]|nr:holo-ACP synthase [Pseudomonadota bacterium]
MIYGIGTDIVDIRRIAEAVRDDKFVARVFTKEEIARTKSIKSKKQRDGFFAKRFAAKEAIAKALGTGIGKSVMFKDISISNDAKGAPKVTLTGNGAKSVSALGKGATVHLSLADDYPYAQAFVVISGK